MALRKLLKYGKKYKWNLVASIIANIFTAFFSVVTIPTLVPFFNILFEKQQIVTTPPKDFAWYKVGDLMKYFDYFLSQIITEHGERRALLIVCGILLAATFFKNISIYLSRFAMAIARTGVVHDIRTALFKKSMDLSLSFFSNKRKGDLISRMTNDVNEIELSILNFIQIISKAPFLIIGSIMVMIAINPRLTIFVFVLFLVTGVVIGGIGKALRKQSSDIQVKHGLLISLLEEGLNGLKIIKGFNANKFQAKNFSKENNAYRHLVKINLWRKDLASPTSEFLGVLVMVILIWFAYAEVVKGNLLPGAFLAFLYAFFNIIEPSKSISNAFNSIQKGMAAVDRVNFLLDAKEDITSPANPVSIQKIQKSIEFKNVHFRYSNHDLVLNDINLKVKKGQTIALVGNSGAGKTTLVDLLPRFYDCTNGQILFDGKNIKDYKLDDLRDMFGIVTQDAVLFHGSVRDNILFGMEGISNKKLEEAAKSAFAHDFILEMKDGYDTNVGDKGANLSGGQRQRITIARAILKNPEILIFDEATSALDSESEKYVQVALDKLLKNRTSFVIAHRLSTIRNADVIVVMKDGKIIEMGSHDELASKSGAYKKLLALQGLLTD